MTKQSTSQQSVHEGPAGSSLGGVAPGWQKQSHALPDGSLRRGSAFRRSRDGSSRSSDSDNQDGASAYGASTSSAMSSRNQSFALPDSSAPTSNSDTRMRNRVRRAGPNHTRDAHSPIDPSNSKSQSAGFNRRNIFGRSSSIRNLLGLGGSSDAISNSTNDVKVDSYDAAKPPQSTSKEPSSAFLRQIGSKSFLDLSESRSMSASSDHLPLTEQPRRMSDSLGMFGRRRGKSVSKHHDLQSDDAADLGQRFTKSGSESSSGKTTRRSGNSSPSTLSLSSSERKRRSTEAPIARESKISESVDASVGIPRRFTGWLQNIVQSDSTSLVAAKQTLSPVKETDRKDVRPSTLTPHPSVHHSQKFISPPIKAGNESESPLTASSPLLDTKPSVGSRAGTLLQTLIPTPTNTSKSAGVGNVKPTTGWSVSSGVGIDRAFRAFLGNDSDSQTEDGIWLLGVWHGPGHRKLEVNVEVNDQEAILNAPQNVSSVSDHFAFDDDTVALSFTSSPGMPAMSDSLAFVNSQRRPHIQRSSQVASSVDTVDTNRGADSIRSHSPGTSVSRADSSLTGNATDWHATFEPDFSSRIWCTYRSQFGPITRDGSISDEAASAAEELASLVSAQTETAPATEPGLMRSWLGRKPAEFAVSSDQSASSAAPSSLGLGAALGASYATATSSLGDKMGITNLWGRATAAAQAAGFSKGLTTDAGWGCMLRTGQSLLANALMDVHLGRSWQKTSSPLRQEHFFEQLSSSHSDRATEIQALAAWRQERRHYATYIKILSWFLDDASPASPFSVHRMAREGKRLGKEVGEWFGPSTAAGAIKELASNFKDAGIGVVLDHDGVFHLTEVRAASTQRDDPHSKRTPSVAWQRPVLILIGIRLGLETVNPIYYDSVKTTFSFPQSVGIAGGRPSSSYYFIGHQGNSLFYLDPHNVRPAVALRYPPKTYPAAVPDRSDAAYRYERAPTDDEDEWWAHAYSEAQTSSFHCEKPRRMPIKSLDPSMLLGFLVRDEASLSDLCTRIKSLPKTIFSFADTAPTWVDDDDFDPSMESFSEASVGDITEGHGPTRYTASGVDDVDGTQELQHGLAPSMLRLASGTSTDTAQQRTVDWLGRGFLSTAASGSGIAFPSVENNDTETLRRPLRNETRLVSSSSAATARPGVSITRDYRLRDSTRDGSTSAAASTHAKEFLDASSTITASGSMGVLKEDAFSLVDVPASAADSAWEEVSEAGAMAPSASAAAVAQLLDQDPSSPIGVNANAGVASADEALSDSVMIERPSPIAPQSADVIVDDMVAVSLDTPVPEASRDFGIANVPTLPVTQGSAKKADGDGYFQLN